jgi:hypothetical protein
MIRQLPEYPAAPLAEILPAGMNCRPDVTSVGIVRTRGLEAISWL